MTANQKTSSSSPWVRLFILFFIGGAIAAGLGYFSMNESFKVVGNQLQALRNHRVSKAYYEYTSKEFQQTTSLPQFREFLSIYPVLHDNVSYRIESSTIENNRAQVTGILVSKGMEEMKADWGLVKEGDEWKVVSLRLTELQRDDEAEKVTKQMIDFAKGQLNALREKDFVEAYYGFVSKDFQKETSIEQFESFVKDNPILFNYRMVESEDGRVENDRGYVNLSLENGKGTYLLNYVLSRELGEWKVYSLKVVLPPEVAVEKAATNPEALVPPIKELLEALASDQTEHAYQLTSRDFQDSTPYENFEEFIQTFPAFSDREMADIKKGEVQNGTGSVRVNLHDDEGITAVDFRMGFSDGEWFIWGIEVVDSPVKQKEKSSNTIVEKEIPPLADQLMSVLRRQMAYLHHQDIYEAYELIMSEDYRSRQSIEDFEEFFTTNPVFMDHRSSYFNRIHDQGETAALRGFVTTYEDETFPVRFEFAKEDGEWKINGLQLLKEAEPIAQAEDVLDGPEIEMPPKPLEFVNVVMGTKIDGHGVVTVPLDEVEIDTELLFFNANLEHVQPHTVVTLFLEHVDSGTSAPQLSTTLHEEGKALISFSYAAPKDGWPPGDYIAKFATSTGQEHLFKVNVKEKETSKK